MQKVFVVIVNFNGLKDTLECVKSVKKCIAGKRYKLEIVVVDNGSSKDWESIKSIKGVKPIKSDENTGFSGGNNLGIKYALKNGADFIMLLNNDTTVKDDLIVNFLDAAELSKDVGIFSPKIYFAPGFEFHKN